MVDNERSKESILQLYQALVDQGISPFVAKQLSIQQVAEGGYAKKWWTGDHVKFDTPQQLATHIVDMYGKNYPDSLKATTFQQFYDGLQRTGRKGMYNSFAGYEGYKKYLLSYAPAISKRIDAYEASKTTRPTAVPQNNLLMQKIAITPEQPDALRVTQIQPIPVVHRYGGKLKRHING